MTDLLREFDEPAVMDIKIGIRYVVHHHRSYPTLLRSWVYSPTIPYPCPVLGLLSHHTLPFSCLGSTLPPYPTLLLSWVYSPTIPYPCPVLGLLSHHTLPFSGLGSALPPCMQLDSSVYRIEEAHEKEKSRSRWQLFLKFGSDPTIEFRF